MQNKVKMGKMKESTGLRELKLASILIELDLIIVMLILYINNNKEMMLEGGNFKWVEMPDFDRKQNTTSSTV